MLSRDEKQYSLFAFFLLRWQMSALKQEKRQRDQQRKQKNSESRVHLANVRVVQKNLVFVVGLPPRLADAEVSLHALIHSSSKAQLMLCFVFIISL